MRQEFEDQKMGETGINILWNQIFKESLSAERITTLKLSNVNAVHVYYITFPTGRVERYNHFSFFWIKGNILRSHDVVASCEDFCYTLTTWIQQLDIVRAKPTYNNTSVFSDV